MKRLLLSALVLGLFTFGCGTCPDVPGFFDIENVMLQNMNSRLGYSDSLTYSYPDSVKFEHYYLQANYQVRYYGITAPPSFSFVPAAYALSCAEPGDGGTKEKLQSVELIALTDFNENFKAGSSLNSIIKIHGLPVPEYVSRQEREGIDSYGLQIELTQKPDPKIKQAFRLIYTLQGGEIYQPESTPDQNLLGFRA